jgi:hypothetical protein
VGFHVGSQSDTSSDDEADEGFEEWRRWSRAPLISTSLAIAELWLSGARKCHIFYKSVSSMIQNQRRDCCQFCLRTKNMCKTLIAGIERDGLLDFFCNWQYNNIKRQNLEHKILDSRDFVNHRRQKTWDWLQKSRNFWDLHRQKISRFTLLEKLKSRENLFVWWA